MSEVFSMNIIFQTALMSPVSILGAVGCFREVLIWDEVSAFWWSHIDKTSYLGRLSGHSFFFVSFLLWSGGVVYFGQERVYFWLAGLGLYCPGDVQVHSFTFKFVVVMLRMAWATGRIWVIINFSYLLILGVCFVGCLSKACFLSQWVLVGFSLKFALLASLCIFGFVCCVTVSMGYSLVLLLICQLMPMLGISSSWG